MAEQSGTYVPIGDEGMHDGYDPTPYANEDPPKPKGPLDDIVSGLRASFQATVSLGRSVDKLSQTNERMWRMLQKNTPVYYGSVASGVFPAAGSLLLNFGSPDTGTRWEVTAVTIGGVDYNVASSGTAGLYIAGNALARGMMQCADFAPSLPNQATYGHDQVVVNDNEFLFAFIDAGTVGQTYAGNASVTVWQTSAGGGRGELNV